MGVHVSIDGGKEKRWLLTHLKLLFNHMGITRGSWAISAVNDATMIELHDRSMAIPETTDVLTFDMRDGEDVRKNSHEGAAVELETVVCINEARRRARELGHATKEELLLYCVHSLLHVQGYDDRTPAEARRMHAREDEILRAIGVGAVYSGKSSGTRQRAARKTSRRKRSGS